MKKRRKIKVRKSSGLTQLFSNKKLRGSLERSGASSILAKKAADYVKDRIEEPISTEKLRSLATQFIKKEDKKLPYHYNLKKSLLELGPDGYTFEKFVSKVFEKKGHKVSINQLRKGKCVTHEIDIIVKNRGLKSDYIECKFHNSKSYKNDIKTVLYLYARYLDLKKRKSNNIRNFLVVSNTKFSLDALKYSECVGLKIFTPEYPSKQNLCSFITETKAYPITCLNSVTKKMAKFLIKNKVITIFDLKSSFDVLDSLDLSTYKKVKIQSELDFILNGDQI